MNIPIRYAYRGANYIRILNKKHAFSKSSMESSKRFELCRIGQRQVTRRCYSNQFGEPKSNNSSTTSQSSSINQRLRELGKLYGSTSLAVYLTLSSTSLTCIFVAIWNGVDVEKYLENIKEKLGFRDSKESTEKTEFEKQSSNSSSGWSLERFGTTFLVAFAANKLLSPLKAMITLFITPSVAKWWRNFRKFK